MNPKELAQQENDRLRHESAQQRAQRQIEEDSAEYPTQWQGYDPSEGRHIVQRLGGGPVRVGISLSSGGFQVGQSVDAAFSQGYTAIDTRPHIAKPVVEVVQPRPTIQIAMLIFQSRFNRPGIDAPVDLLGTTYLKIDNQRLKPIYSYSRVTPAIPQDSPSLDMLAVGANQYAISVFRNSIATIYYYNRGAISTFDGTLEPIPGVPGIDYFVYPANSISNYLVRGTNSSYPEYYYPPVYLQTDWSGNYGEKLIAPYKRKITQILNQNNTTNNWLNLLQRGTYKLQANYPSEQLHPASISTQITMTDVGVMGFTPDTVIRAGTTSAVLGTFENPGTGWNQTQIEVRQGDVYNLLTVVYFRGIPVDA